MQFKKIKNNLLLLIIVTYCLFFFLLWNHILFFACYIDVSLLAKVKIYNEINDY